MVSHFATINQESAKPVEIAAPPSKSLSHRYLIGAALAQGQSTVKNTLESTDLEATRAILCAAGAKMEPLDAEEGKNTQAKGWRVKGMGGKPRGGSSAPLQCDVGESGTTCRLLAAVLAAGTGLFRFYGHGRMHERPIGELCYALESLGCGVVYEENKGYPPFVLQAHGLVPALADGTIRMGMDNSSQFFSGLLLAAPMAVSPLCFELAGHKAVSWPYVGLTLQCLEDFGIAFSVQNRPRIGTPWIDLQPSTWRNLEEVRPGCLRVRVWPGAYRSGDYHVEGDWSAAAYFLAAGALGQKPVKVVGIRANSLQGDRAMIRILEQMGAKVVKGADFVTVYPSKLHGVDLDMGSCPDLVPTVAVLATFASGSTRIRNVAHLRIKESDRIAAPAEELRKTGAIIDTLSDGMLLSGRKTGIGNKKPTSLLPADTGLNAHNDHRIAMSLALLELKEPQLKVRERLDDPSVVRKSFPGFWDTWSLLQ